jgi:beta-xylosidase
MASTRRLINLGLLLALGLTGLTQEADAGNRLANRPASAAPSAPGGSSFFDGFDSSTLGAGWSWVREQNDDWSLTERPGFLRIHTAEGTLDGALADNVLLRAAPGFDYEVSTRVEINVTQNYHEASLLLYANDNNYIKLSRIYRTDEGGAFYLFRREVAGVGAGAFSSGLVSATSSDFRIRFVAPSVFAEYRAGAGAWTAIGSFQVGPIDTYDSVGIVAHHGEPVIPATSIPADFDYFDYRSLISVRLPAIFNN